MPSDPKQCRLNAIRCAELAAGAKERKLKTLLLELTMGWVKLAENLERTHALLDDDPTNFNKPT